MRRKRSPRAGSFVTSNTMPGMAVATEVNTSRRAARPLVSVHSVAIRRDQHHLLDRPRQQGRLTHRFNVGRLAGIDTAGGQILRRRNALPNPNFGRPQRPRRGHSRLIIALLLQPGVEQNDRRAGDKNAKHDGDDLQGTVMGTKTSRYGRSRWRKRVKLALTLASRAAAANG